MKGKIILALASIFAGTALVGSTFAASAWAVTDNAGTKTAKYSGEKIEADASTAYVTLEYGSSTALTDVANLEAGTARYAGAVGLKATYTGASSYNGLLTVRISQAAREGARLIDYLTLKVYDKAPTYDEDKVISALASGTQTLLTLDASHLTASVSVPMTTGSEKVVYVAVELSEAAGTASILNTVKSDVVNMSLDWDHDPNGQTEANTQIVYYKPTLEGTAKPYIYAWKDKAFNAEYPGVQMTEGSDGYYYYEINTTLFDHFILSYGDGTEAGNTKAREADFAVTEIEGNANYFNGTEWTTKPVADPTLTAEYYLVTDSSDWACVAANALVDVSTQVETIYQITGVTLAAGAKLKVRTNSNNTDEHWYSCVSTWDGCGFTIDGEGNLVISAAGTYTINFYPNSTYNNYVIPSLNA